MIKIEMGREYRTQDGYEVRIYATDGGGLFSVHGAVKKPTGGWWIVSWTEFGEVTERNPMGAYYKLIEVKPRIKCDVWVNVYKSFLSSHNSKTEADMYAAADRIACVKLTIDVEEGHGL
jgi:hypothetical protein